MAVTWGAWEYSGGNGMRVGIEVDWATPSHGTTVLDADVHVWTENQYSYSDNQTLTYGGSISGTTDFSNQEGGSPEERANKDYNYTYSGSSYGSSPSTKTFTATLSGAFNGVTPSVSVSSPVPARPYAAPAAPSGCSASRASDTTINVSWNNNATAGEPYTSQTLQRRINGGSWVTVSSSISGSADTYAYTSTTNGKYEFQVRATNSIGTSSYSGTSSPVYTTPAAPSSAVRTGANGANQVITWTDNAGYAEHSTEVWVYANGAAATLLATVAGPSPVSTYTHTGPPSAATRWKYKVRHKTTSGTTLYSGYSADTTETTGTTSAPNQPTGLAPTGGVVVNQIVATTLTWTHNPTDTTPQTKFQVRHRVGAGAWTTTPDQVSAVSSYSLPANTYAGGQLVEWQVATYGTNATMSAWSASATFTTLAVVARLPVIVNLATGDWEAGSEIQAGTPGGVAGVLLLNNMGGDVKLFDQASTFPELIIGGSDARELRANKDQLRALNGASPSTLYLNNAGRDVETGARINPGTARAMRDIDSVSCSTTSTSYSTGTPTNTCNFISEYPKSGMLLVIWSCLIDNSINTESTSVCFVIRDTNSAGTARFDPNSQGDRARVRVLGTTGQFVNGAYLATGLPTSGVMFVGLMIRSSAAGNTATMSQMSLACTAVL